MRRRAGVAVQEATTAAIPGRWFRASATTRTRASGNRVPAGSACTRSCATGTACTSASRPAATTLSEDGGSTFAASNTGVGAGFAPDPYPEFGQCVHKIVGHKDAPGRLYMQNHGGWAEWGRAGRAAAGHRRAAAATTTAAPGARSPRGCPSDSGFPIVVHPHDPDTVYVMPL